MEQHRGAGVSRRDVPSLRTAAVRGLEAFDEGRYDDAIRLLRRAAAQADVVQDGNVHITLAHALGAAGRYDEAVDTLLGIRSGVAPGSPMHTRSTVILTAALCDAGRPEEARRALYEIALSAEGDLRLLGRYLWASARISTFEHDPEGALTTIDEAIEVYRRLGSPIDVGRLHLVAAEALNCQVGRHVLALSHVDEAEEALTDPSCQDRTTAMVHRAHALAALGAPETALALARSALDELDPSTQEWERGMARWAIASALERLGAPEAHGEYLQAFRKMRSDTRYIPRLAEAIMRTRPTDGAAPDIRLATRAVSVEAAAVALRDRLDAIAGV